MVPVRELRLTSMLVSVVALPARQVSVPFRPLLRSDTPVGTLFAHVTPTQLLVAGPVQGVAPVHVASAVPATVPLGVPTSAAPHKPSMLVSKAIDGGSGGLGGFGGLGGGFGGRGDGGGEFWMQ